MGKAVYQVKNWPEYNEALVKRGDLTFWLNESVLADWQRTERSGRPGRPQTFSDSALECMLALRSIFRLPLRGTEGLMRSLFVLLGIAARVPTFATLSRRQGRLKIDLGAVPAGEPLHLLIDSTGLKVFGEGEWKTRQHGIGKRRTWRKLHLAIDAKSRQIVSVELTGNDTHDAEVLPKMLAGIDCEIEKVGADGAYDTWKCRYAIHERGASAVIPPREDAVFSKRNHPAALERNEAVEHQYEWGRKHWKQQSGYHTRSLVETTMFQIKRTFGAETQAREIQNQIAEAVMKSKILNTFIQHGLPRSVKIPS